MRPTTSAVPNERFSWSRFGGYECSTMGSRTYSAFHAILGGRSIECHYQCDVKGYDPGGTNWRIGKGKPPLNKNVDTWTEYLNLWARWANMHQLHMHYLGHVALGEHNGVLSDRFATTPINQAHALATLLNRHWSPSRADRNWEDL